MKKVVLFLFFFLCSVPFANADENIADDLVAKFKLDTITNSSKLLVLDTALKKPHFYMLKRFKNEWVCLKDSTAEIGRGGAKKDKIEGDYATPKGVFNFLIAFGTKENPGCILPYYQLKSGDVWVIDPQSKYYNLFVRKNTVFKDWLAEIELFKRPVRYKYVLVMDYNITHKQPYKGSAIFLECSIGKPTDGSIALPPSLMEELLLFVDKETQICIF